MAYQLIERPHKFSFSKNPVRYVFNITNPAAAGCALEIELYSLAIGSLTLPGTLITRQTLTPNPDGSLEFYCEDFLNSFLDWELPNLTNNDILACTSQIAKFYIRYRQTTKNNPSPPYATEEENVRIVLKGGVAKEKFDRNNFFINYLPANKPFLTWLPDRHFVGTEERRYLTYFHYSGDQLTDVLQEIIYKENMEWAASSNSGNIDVASPNNPKEGLLDIEATDSEDGNEVTLIGAGVVLPDFNTLLFDIRSKGPWDPGEKIIFSFYNEVTLIGSVELADGDYGFDSANVDDYQTISIPIAFLDSADRLKITRDGVTTIGFYLDNIILKQLEELPPVLKLKGRAVWTDGTQETVTIDFPLLSESLLFHCPAGLDQLGLAGLHPDKKMWYYDVSVEDDAGNVFALPYRLYADHRKYYNVFSFIYHNSLSGIDTLRIRGEYDLEINRDFTEIQKATGGNFSNEILPTENGAINISKFEVYKGDAGLMNTKRQQDACQDLLLSENVYRVIFNRWLRVVNMQKNQPMGATDDTKWIFPLQWRYTFDNTQYTPFNKDFGAGSNTEDPGAVYGQCTAPTDLAVEFVGPDGGGKQYHFSWNAVIGAESYEVQYTDILTGAWITIGLPATNELDYTFETVEGDYSWRVRTKCGEDDYSGYANGPGFHITEDSFACAGPDIGSLSTTLQNIDDTNATVRLAWGAVGGVLGYIVEWRVYNTGAWNTAFTAALFYDVTVPNDAQYEWRVKSQCNDTPDYSGYTYGPHFIPANMVGTCNGPSGLNAEVFIFSFFALTRFFWVNAPAVTDYNLQYREVATTTWSEVNNINSGYSTFVDKFKTYEWRVRSNCAAGGFSGWMNGPNFNS